MGGQAEVPFCPISPADRHTLEARLKSGDTPDLVDRKILSALTANARISISNLASRIHLSRPAVQARIARLEESGVIRGYHADVRLSLNGSGLPVLLLARIGVRPCAPALTYLLGQPEVRQVWSVAGPHDAVIDALTTDAKALSELTDRLAASPFRIEAEARTILAAFGKPSGQTDTADQQSGCEIASNLDSY